MDTLMIHVIELMKDTQDSHSQRETTFALKKCVPGRSNEGKDTVTDSKTKRSSSFSILRNNVLQYVEEGGWNPEVQETTPCVPVGSQERKTSEKTSCSSKLQQDVSSCECPAATKSPRDDLRPLPLSQSYSQDAKSNYSNCENQGNDFRLRADHSDGMCSSNSNLRDLTVIQSSEKAMSPPISQSDYLTSLKRIYGSTGELSYDGSPGTGLTDNSAADPPNMKSISSDSVDSCGLQGPDTNMSEPEGLSTYTLHSRWQEVLPKEVIQQISRGSTSNRKHLLQNVNEENNLTDSTQFFTDSQWETSVADADSIVLNCQNSELNSEFCWSRNGVTVEESADDIENCFNLEECVPVAKTSTPFDESGNSHDSVDEPPQKLSSIQDTYRNILKTIKKVNNGSISSSYFSRKIRRSRKAKKKDKIQPMYTCPRCQSKYLVSSKKAIAISKCLKCELWTSVNDEQTDDEDEVTVSFCCLS